MRKITAIPSKKIAFKNVPISGLFFSKRTLYVKNSSREACYYDENKQIYFEPQEIVRYITKQHENIAVEVYKEKNSCGDESNQSFTVNEIVEIPKHNAIGRIVSLCKTSCFVQYKQDDSVCFNEFQFTDLRKHIMK
ncbi:MAG: hypothetical protein Q7R33_06035 [Nitrosarchaeum sp.]|nr:hypothetical protein [Nitrosarchaeum sp.]